MTKARQKAEERLAKEFNMSPDFLEMCHREYLHPQVQKLWNALVSRELELEKLRWIPCSERLPEFIGGWCDRGGRDKYRNTARVLVRHKTGFDVGELLREEKSASDFSAARDVWVCGEETLYNVTHWMPLPEAPKEGL